jgi:hypothetical protein
MSIKENAAPQLATATNKSIVKVQKKQPYRKSNAVKLLEAMANDEAQRNNPNTPPEWIAPRKFRDNSANGLTKCIIDFIRLSGGQAERISNTGRQITRYKSYVDVVGFQRSIINTHWIPGNGTNGTADISAVIKSLSVKIEVKHGHDRQSTSQWSYQRQVQQAGGIYVIATSFEQFYHWYSERFANNAS